MYVTKLTYLNRLFQIIGITIVLTATAQSIFSPNLAKSHHAVIPNIYYLSSMNLIDQPAHNNRKSSNHDTTSNTELIRFDGSTPANVWQIVNDTVMGGRSQSRIIQDDGFARFEGTLSLENNGGFASMRLQASQSVNLSAFDGISVRAKGDSREYHLRIKTVENGRITSYSWESPFKSTKEWNEHQLSFSSFRPVFRGRNLTNVPRLDTSKIIEIGVMIKDGRQGTFSISLEEIAVFEN